MQLPTLLNQSHSSANFSTETHNLTFAYPFKLHYQFSWYSIGQISLFFFVNQSDFHTTKSNRQFECRCAPMIRKWLINRYWSTRSSSIRPITFVATCSLCVCRWCRRWLCLHSTCFCTIGCTRTMKSHRKQWVHCCSLIKVIDFISHLLMMTHYLFLSFIHSTACLLYTSDAADE